MASLIWWNESLYLDCKRIFLSFCITWAPQDILTNRILTNNEGSKARRENIFQIYCCLKKVFTFQEDKLFACSDKMLMSVVSVVKSGAPSMIHSLFQITWLPCSLYHLLQIMRHVTSASLITNYLIKRKYFVPTFSHSIQFHLWARGHGKHCTDSLLTD